MKPFFIEITVRWSDLDANRHLANASYMNYTSHARINYLDQLGISMKNLAEWNIGPAVLREKFSFFKESFGNQQIIVTVEQTGVSENGEMFEFTHNFYSKKDGTHLAYSRVFGVWFSMDKRKIAAPPAEMFEKAKAAFDVNSIKKLGMEDLKNLPVKPQNINVNELLSVNVK